MKAHGIFFFFATLARYVSSDETEAVASEAVASEAVGYAPKCPTKLKYRVRELINGLQTFIPEGVEISEAPAGAMDLFQGNELTNIYGNKIGTVSGSCVLMANATDGGNYNCLQTFTFDRLGQLNTQGPSPSDWKETGTYVVTGGTDPCLKGAWGTMTIKPIDPNYSAYDYELHVTIPPKPTGY